MSNVTPVPLFSEFRTVTYVHGYFVTVSQEDGVCLRACVCVIFITWPTSTSNTAGYSNITTGYYHFINL